MTLTLAIRWREAMRAQFDGGDSRSWPWAWFGGATTLRWGTCSSTIKLSTLKILFPTKFYSLQCGKDYIIYYSQFFSLFYRIFILKGPNYT